MYAVIAFEQKMQAILLSYWVLKSQKIFLMTQPNQLIPWLIVWWQLLEEKSIICLTSGLDDKKSPVPFSSLESLFSEVTFLDSAAGFWWSFPCSSHVSSADARRLGEVPKVTAGPGGCGFLRPWGSPSSLCGSSAAANGKPCRGNFW